MRYALLAVVVLGLAGCFTSAPSYVIKQKAVEKSPDGTVTKIIDTEYVIQPADLEDITLEILKVGKPKPSATSWKTSTETRDSY